MVQPVFTLYKKFNLKHGKILNLSWEDCLKHLFSEHKVIGSAKDSPHEDVLDAKKLEMPAVVLGEIPDRRVRNKENVTEVYALSIDLDKSPEEEIMEKIQPLTDFEFICYTTHKHGSIAVNGIPRIRIILPLKGAFPAADFPQYWHALNNMIGGINDPQTKDCCRLNFLPSTFDLSLAWIKRNESSKFLSIEDLKPYIKKQITPETDLYSEVEDSETIDQIHKALKKIGKKNPLKPAADALIDGKPLAPKSERHDTVVKLTMWLAQRNSNMSEQQLRVLFSESLQAMNAISPNDPISFEETYRAYQGAAEKVQHQIKGDSYSQTQLEHIATQQSCTIQELDNRWVLLGQGGGGWILLPTGNYSPFFDKAQIMPAIRQELERAPIELFRVTQNGIRQKTLDDIVYEYGGLCTAVVSDMSAQWSTFDPLTHTLREAVCPIRTDLRPQFYPEIDTWLQLLGRHEHTKLVDFFSVVPQLDKLCGALYIHSVPGAGKNMLAFGLSRIWKKEGQPTDIKEVMSNFNEVLAKCPLIFVDESMPKRYPQESVTPLLRSILSTTSRSLTRKYKPPADLTGSIRLVIVGNNPFMLASGDVGTKEDLSAVSQRFIYIKNLEEDATHYLENLGQDVLASWWTHKIAEHSLWLAENHVIQNPGKRFVVEGSRTEMHNLLLFSTDWNNRVCEWLVRYLNNPLKLDSIHEYSDFVRVKDGELWINEEVLLAQWHLYLHMGEHVKPNTAKIGAAVKAMTVNEKRKQWKTNEGGKLRFRQIDTSFLFDWSEENNIGDPERMQAVLDGHKYEDLKNVKRLPVKQETLNLNKKETDEKEGY